MPELNPYQILIRPVITEKSTRLQEEGRYVFEVPLSATKTQIKEAVEKAFGVKVVEVNTVIVKGKRKRWGPRLVQRPTRKKAVVTLQPGQKIPVFEGV